jgi:uncharacterized protein with HEPN domain
MPARDAAKYLWDALRAVERIERFVANQGFEDYLANDMLRAAVERQFEIIGEALSGLKRVDLDRASTIPDLARIIAFRNILIHGYASIDDQLVWGVVEADLPILRRALEAQLAAFPAPE